MIIIQNFAEGVHLNTAFFVVLMLPNVWKV